VVKVRGGFDPDRLSEPHRPAAVVPQIIDESAALERRASGFTEVRIVGVGGGGNNAVNRMVEAGVHGVEFVAVNTDAQALALSQAANRLVIGSRTSRGLGAGGDPAAGSKAAEISRDVLEEMLGGADMVFVTAGMGGGTGTGAAPVIAEIARAQHALTVGVVTLPFRFEGNRRLRVAEEGVARLREVVDALIVIPNERLHQYVDRQMTVVEAFRLADDVLRQGVQGISDLVTMTGLINLDFADVKSVMAGAGTALMAIGEARGEDRATQAARLAVSSPLLDVSIEGARGVLINVTGGPELTLLEVSEAANAISDAVDPAANIIFGAVVLPRPQAELKLTLIATGLRSEPVRQVAREAPTRERYPADRPALDRDEIPDRIPSRYAAPRASARDDDDEDLDMPAFMRRRRLG
jgi:cell division protein FtsZ